MSEARVTSEVLTLERRGHVAWLWLDHAARRNALGPDFWRDFPEAVDACLKDEAVRVIVLAGRGPVFCSGLDLKQTGVAALGAGASGGSDKPGPDAEWRRWLIDHIRFLQKGFTALAQSDTPSIACIHGACLGGGVDMATACDIRLAARDAVFSVRETRLAMVADLGTLQRLPRQIGVGRANELIFTGRDFDAAEAEKIGFVNAVHDSPEALHAAADRLAGEIAANSPLAVQGANHVMKRVHRASDEDGLAHVALWNGSFLYSNDLIEAMTAFGERRPPDYSGT